jgi:hypothetical protein
MEPKIVAPLTAMEAVLVMVSTGSHARVSLA